MKTKKRIVALVVISSLILSMFSGISLVFSDTEIVGDSTTYEGISQSVIFRGSVSWEDYKIQEGLPSDLPERSLNGLEFNYEVWQDIHFIVFGDWTDIPNNDFKAGTQPHANEPIIPDSGYYIKNGKRGMYRYHGWDKTGSVKVSSNIFVADISSSKGPESKLWVYDWFKDSRKHYLQSTFSAGESFRNVKISEPTALAVDGMYKILGELPKTVNSGEQLYIRKWIGDTLRDPIQKATYTGYDTETDLDPYHYLNVESEPTTRYTGKSRAFHLTKKEELYYYNLKLNPIADKIVPENYVKAEFVDTEDTLTDDKYVVKTTLTGETLEKIFENDIEKTIYYNQDDIESWTFQVQENINNTLKTQEGTRTSYNTAESDFEFEYGKDVIDNYKDADGNVDIEVTLYGVATVNMVNGASFSDMVMLTISNKGVVQNKMTLPADMPQDPRCIEVEFDAPTKMLDIDTFDIEITEGDMSNLESRQVFIEGNEITGQDKEDFLNGNYKFPIIGETKVYDYEVIYNQKENLRPAYIKSFVNVYDHRPDANSNWNGTFKENRSFGVNTTFITPAYVEGRSASRISNLTLTSNDGTIYKKGNDYLMKNTGIVQLNYTVSNDFGSRSYSKDLFIQEDFRPDIIAQVWNPQMIRDEKLDLYFSAVSTDGDEIDNTANTYKIMQDTNNNGEYDLVLEEGSFDPSTPPEFTAPSLGKFAIEFKTKEAWVEETIEEYITTDDYKTHEDIVYFEVVNSSPITKIDTDFDFDFPQVELFTVIDSNINDTSKSDLKAHRIDFNNSIRRQGIDSHSEMWDTKVYTFTTTGAKTINTGGSYPPATYNYSDSNGYTGTIPRTNVVNDRYKQDDGRYRTKKTCTSEPIYKNVWNGRLCGWDYTDDGFSIARRCDVIVGYKEVCHTTRYWDSDWNWYNNYTGYYSGTVSKDVKQEWDYAVRDTSEKVLVYYTDSTINNLNDLTYLKTLYPDNTIIEVSSLNSGDNDLYIPYTTDEENIYKQIGDYLKSRLPETEGITLLKGDTLNIYTASIDEENDPLLKEEYQIIHDKNYYDTSDSMFDLASSSTYSESNYTEGVLPSSITLNKAGKYQIYKRITDLPNGDETYSEISNEAMLEFYVHRKPFADFSLDWTFNPSISKYELNWIDKSYDLDFINRSDKGVVQRKLKYRKVGDIDWVYGEPTALAFGDYEMEYIVKDNYGAWSDVNYLAFTLANVPPPQLIKADLKVVDNSFSLSSIPVTEDLKWADVITRFPYQEQLRIEIRDDSNTLKKTYIKTNSDTTTTNLSWGDEEFSIIPDTMIDGNYTAYIYAEDSNNTSNNVSKNEAFIIDTPVDLVVTDTVSMLSYDTVRLEVETSKYVDDVRATIFKGTAHEEVVSFNYDKMNGKKKIWYYNYDTNEAIPEAEYIITYRAETTNGNVETASKTVEVIWLRINNITVNPIDPMRGDNIIVELDTSGKADTARIIIDPQMQTVENRSEVATHLRRQGELRNKRYQPADGTYEYDINENINNKVDILEFVTGLEYSINIINGSQVLAPYIINVEVERGAIIRTATFDLNFDRDVRETLKME